VPKINCQLYKVFADLTIVSASKNVACAIQSAGHTGEATMVNLELINGENSTELLTVQGASQMTGGLLSERKIWQLVKEKQLSYVNEGDNSGIPISEIMRLVGIDTAVRAA